MCVRLVHSYDSLPVTGSVQRREQDGDADRGTAVTDARARDGNRRRSDEYALTARDRNRRCGDDAVRVGRRPLHAPYFARGTAARPGAVIRP